MSDDEDKKSIRDQLRPIMPIKTVGEVKLGMSKRLLSGAYQPLATQRQWVLSARSA